MASEDPSPTQTFARTAQAFIAALKQDSPLSAADLYQAIIALQAAALALPGDFYDFEAPSKPDYLTAYNARREALARCLPKGLGYYHTCHNPLDVSFQPTQRWPSATPSMTLRTSGGIWRQA